VEYATPQLLLVVVFFVVSVMMVGMMIGVEIVMEE